MKSGGHGTQAQRKGLCGCWNALNTHPDLDLRLSPTHGTPGHARHETTVHAWCALCSPGSVPVFESILGPFPTAEPESKMTTRT